MEVPKYLVPNASTQSSDEGTEARDRVHYFPKDYYHSNLPIEIPDAQNRFYQDSFDHEYICIGSSPPRKGNDIPFFSSALGDAEGSEPFWSQAVRLTDDDAVIREQKAGGETEIFKLTHE